MAGHPAHSLFVLCCEPIGESYLREIGTRLSYCNHNCYVDHRTDAVLALENRAGIVNGQTAEGIRA